MPSADKPAGTDTLSFGPFQLKASERSLIREGTAVAIGGRALDLLIALTARPGQVLSRRELVDLVWPDVVVEEANLRVHIAALRRLLGDGKEGARYIANVPGRGYVFVATVDRSKPQGAERPSPQPVARARHLPPLPHRLIGRTEVIVRLSSLLRSRRFVSVIGPGGIGKTTVALAVAHGLREELGDEAVRFVDLGSLTDADQVVGAVCSALGCVAPGADPAGALVAFLAGERTLIVLDSCEHVIETVAPLAERLFRQVPSVHLLSTSREALRVDGENVHLLAALESPAASAPSAAEALASPAVQLFVDRAASSGHWTELGDAEAQIVAAICRRLGGVALAIELVASRVGSYGIRGTADLLESGGELLLHGRSRGLPRHRTLQALHDWSFGLLSEDEQKVLRRLAVLVGPFTLEAAQAVAGEDEAERHRVGNALAGLVDKSLVQVSSASAAVHYRLLDTTRAYAAVKLGESGEQEAAARRHALHFVRFLGAQDRGELDFRGRDPATGAVHAGNARKALAWCFSPAGDLSLGIELAACAAPLFLDLSLLEECQRWSRQALASLSEAERGTRQELELQEALAMSSMYARGNSGEARAAIERGLALSEALDDARHRLHLLSGLNLFLMRLGDFKGAFAVAERAAAFAEATGGTVETVMATWMLAASHHMAGDQAAALDRCRLGFRLVSNLEPNQVTFFGFDHHLRALVTLSRCLWFCGFADQGLRTARQTIEEAERCRHPILRCIALLNCIPVLLWSGELEAAAGHAETAIHQAERHSLGPYRAAGLALRGEILVARGDPASGVPVLREALSAFHAYEHHVVTAATSRALAEGLLRCGRSEEAVAVIDRSLALAEQEERIFPLPDLLRARGEILLALPRPDRPEAEAALLRAIAYARRQSALSWELKAALPLSRLWVEDGRGGEARSLLEPLLGRFTEGFDAPDLLAAGRLLDEAGAGG